MPILDHLFYLTKPIFNQIYPNMALSTNSLGQNLKLARVIPDNLWVIPLSEDVYGSILSSQQ